MVVLTVQVYEMIILLKSHLLCIHTEKLSTIEYSIT